MAKRVVPGSLTTNYTNRADDFSPNLVGQQFTDGNAFFTLGNFSLTTNTTQTTGEFFNTGEFSEKFNLDNLELTKEHQDVLVEIAQKQLGYQLTFRAITGEEDLIKNNFLLDEHLKNIYPKDGQCD